MQTPPIMPSQRRHGATMFARNGSLGVAQIILWGGSYYLPAVISKQVIASTGWSSTLVIGALSLAILASGLPAPWVGSLIVRHGGRKVLLLGAALMSLGQVGLALAPNLPLFLIAWLCIGLGMAGTLYDALFSTLGHVRGENARKAIGQVVIVAGFAITISWPASTFLAAHLGWRGAAAVYAALNILVVCPIFWWSIPHHDRSRTEHGPAHASVATLRTPAGLFLLGANFTVAAMIMTAVSVQLLSLLQTAGLTAAAAVAVSALIGPAQFGVRFLEIALGPRLPPYWSHLASTICIVLSMTLLTVSPSIAWLGILLYGAGNGMRTLVRGTLPLTMFGPRDYARLLGRLARPALLGQAITPILCGLVVEYAGEPALLNVLIATAVLNVGLAVCLHRFAIRPKGDPVGTAQLTS